MKKQALILSSLMLTMLAPLTGKAQSSDKVANNLDEWYINFESNVTSEAPRKSNFYVDDTWLENDSKVSFSFGYKIQPINKTYGKIRFEAEFLWKDTSYFSENYDIVNIGAMANMIYDFNTSFNVVPYIGVGVGAANIYNYSSHSSSGSFPAYQTTAGISYTSKLHPYTSIRLGYKYFSTIAPITEYSSHNLDAGIRITF